MLTPILPTRFDARYLVVLAPKTRIPTFIRLKFTTFYSLPSKIYSTKYPSVKLPASSVRSEGDLPERGKKDRNAGGKEPVCRDVEEEWLLRDWTKSMSVERLTP